MGRRCYVLLRRRYDVPTRCCGDAPLRRFGDVPSRRRWVFHLGRTCDVVTMSPRRLNAEWVLISILSVYLLKLYRQILLVLQAGKN